jgi:hypothetical protein
MSRAKRPASCVDKGAHAGLNSRWLLSTPLRRPLTASPACPPHISPPKWSGNQPTALLSIQTLLASLSSTSCVTPSEAAGETKNPHKATSPRAGLRSRTEPMPHTTTSSDREPTVTFPCPFVKGPIKPSLRLRMRFVLPRNCVVLLHSSASVGRSSSEEPASSRHSQYPGPRFALSGRSPLDRHRLTEDWRPLPQDVPRFCRAAFLESRRP